MAGTHIQTQREWEEEKSIEILAFARSQLYMDLPYMSVALGELEPDANDEIRTLATDGNNLFFQSEQVISLFKNNVSYLERAYLHSILHCIFSHLWIAAEKDSLLWGIACDIAVEYTIDMLEKPSTIRALSWLRMETYRKLKEEVTGMSAPAIYFWLLHQDNVKMLMQEFVTDDHRFWPKQENGKQNSSSSLQNKWNKIARQTSLEQKRRGNDKTSGESALASMVEATKTQRSYRDFLQKFSILREELHQDPDEFDLGYYSYGLKMYGNMPLLEPLEMKENRKIQEFVIVLDTSYSTSGDLIHNFLKETFSILTSADSFFRESRVRIIQCDERVRWDKEIKNEREIDALMKEFVVMGGGGTDFRPAFSYVNELREAGQLKHLSGLLYFTDGKGIYPTKRPDYKTAFLFVDSYDESMVPVWAIRQRVFLEEFGGKQ